VTISPADATPPRIVTAAFSATFDDKVTFRFSENVAASLSVGDFEVSRLGRERFSPARLRLTYDQRTNRAILTFASPTGSGELASGLYRLVLKSTGVTDGAGNRLDGDGNGTAGGNLVMYFRKG